MTTMMHAFRVALERLVMRGEFGNRSPWIHDLARRLADTVTP